MSTLDNLHSRLKYRGGIHQEDRMIKDKEESLRRSLLYSYQAETAIMEDGCEFRCLINPNKETGDYDNKIISIPYKDIQLNPCPCCCKKKRTVDGKQYIGLKCGNVFTWKQTDTHWIVWLEYIEENAYFRAQIRRCDQQTDINGKKYWTYIRGPVETSIVWNQKKQIEWNDLNYSLVMYVTRDEHTYEYLHRFAKVKVADTEGIEKTWQVVNANPYFGDGIIQVFLDEYFENTIEEESNKEKDADVPTVEPDLTAPYIEGPLEVKLYDTIKYTIKNISNGYWLLIQDNDTINLGEKDMITLDVVKKKGNFTLQYIAENQTVELDVKIVSI